MATFTAWIVAPCILLWAVPAPAADRAALALRFQLDPSVPECPTELDFRATVSARLGYDPFIPEGQRKVVVRVEAEGARLIGRLSWQEPGGKSQGLRSFTNRVQGCGELVENMAFAVAVQIQLLLEGEPATDAPQSESANDASDTSSAAPTGTARTPDPNPEKDSASAAPPLPSSPTQRSRLAVIVGAGPSLGLGLVPSVAILGRAFVALSGERFALELDAQASLAGTLTQEGGSGFDARIYAASGAACYRLAPWFGCGVGRVGALSVRGFGVDEPKTGSGWVGWLGVRLGARLPLTPRLAFGAYADLTRALGTRTVELDGQTAWHLPSTSVTTGIEWGFYFP